MKKILLILLFSLIPTFAATYNVAYGICNGGPSDFKTGSPTVTLSGDTAIFSVAQTNVLMGVGAMITYNTTSKCFVRPQGKVSTTKWLVTTGVGTQPAGATDQTVNSIKHPFQSISTAELSTVGYVGASYLNTKSLVTADVNMYWACYAEQTGYTKDSTGAAIDSMVGDSTHKFYIFSPTNTTTECNLSMFPNTAKYDSTKYKLKVPNATGIGKTVSANWMTIYNLQLWNDVKTGGTTSAFTTVTLTGETNRVTRCIIVVAGPDTTVSGSALAVTHNTGSAGNLIVDNCLIIGLPWKGTNAGAAIRNVGAAGTGTYYENTVYGAFGRYVLNSSGTTNLRNNFIDGPGTASSATSKDYDVYKSVNESETNGTLTTQSYSQLFSDTSGGAAGKLYWNYSPAAGSDLIGNGTNLAAAYDGDLLHASGYRPKQETWDAGALEYDVSIAISNISLITGERYRVQGSGFKPAATNPTVTVATTAATVDSATNTDIYLTLGAGTARGNDTFSVTNSNSENIKAVGYVYSTPLITSANRIYGAHYRVRGSLFKPSGNPTIKVGGVSATVDTAWTDSVHFTLAVGTPRGTQNIILTNSDTYKDTISATILPGDHAINIFAGGQSNMAGTATGTAVTAAVNSYKWDYANEEWITPADDPYFVGLNNTCLPELTTYLSGSYRDIGIINGAYSGKGYVDWYNSRNASNPFDGSTIYGKALTYIYEAGGIDHMVWYGGETDIIAYYSSDTVKKCFKGLINYFKQDIPDYIADTCPVIFIAPNVDSSYYSVQYGVFNKDSSNQVIRDALKSLHNPDSGYYLAGYAATMKTFDKVHVDTLGLSKAAKMFDRAIKYSDGIYDYCLGAQFLSARYGASKDTIKIKLTKDTPALVPALGAKGFRVVTGTDTVVVNRVDVAGDSIKLSLASAIVGKGIVQYLHKTPINVDSLIYYNDSQNTYLEPTSYVFEQSLIDTIPALASALPLFAKLTPSAHGTITGVGMSVIDTVWYGTVKATIDSATYTTLYVTLPNQTVRGSKDIRTHARYGYRDTLVGAITYKNLHVTSLTPPRGKIGDTVTARAIWGFGTTGMSVTVNDSTATVVAGYVDTLARFVAPNNANGNYSVRFINGSGDTTFTQWTYGTGSKNTGFRLGKLNLSF